MALTVNGTNTFTAARAGNFIPEIWANETIVHMESNLVAAKLFRNFKINGKAGDTFHIPNVSELSANDKAANASVTIQSTAEATTDISIDKHKETSFLVEDIASVQSAYPLRSLYTERAGYAIAKQLDTDLLAATNTAIVAASRTVDGDGTTVTNAGVLLTKAGLVQGDYLLNASDVPTDGRFIIIHPVHKHTILSINDFIQYQMSGDMAQNMLKNGLLGEIMGYKVYMTTNLPNTALGATTNGYYVLMGHKDAAVSAVQMAPRTQGDYMQQYLAHLVTVDQIYGVGGYRASTHCVGLRTPITTS